MLAVHVIYLLFVSTVVDDLNLINLLDSVFSLYSFLGEIEMVHGKKS